MVDIYFTHVLYAQLLVYNIAVIFLLRINHILANQSLCSVKRNLIPLNLSTNATCITCIVNEVHYYKISFFTCNNDLGAKICLTLVHSSSLLFCLPGLFTRLKNLCVCLSEIITYHFSEESKNTIVAFIEFYWFGV